jgi:predicted nucleic acid-binding protein
MLKRNRISVGEALEALSSYRQIPLRFLDVELESAVRLVEKLGIYAYDAYVIAVAEEQRCPVLSLDGGLIRAARTYGVDVLEVEP